ncbi:Chloroperoxidase [Flammula alnicola]|nr:Chloroperoxidase [Flammula alnicola]
MARFLSLFSLLTFLFTFEVTVAFPSYGSLAGLSARELDEIILTLQVRDPESPPGPLQNTSTKLVNDPAHPWIPAGENDIRGPCPGLNTLASHGWLPRNGIATPVQIINAVQEVFNMGNDLAVFVTYGAFLVDGNLLTNLLSIGGKTPETGPDPPAPAIVGGLNTHAVFEGDTSMTRGDAFFGDNHSFNETLFDELTAFSNKFGAGLYNLSVATEFRFQRIKDSIATNPQFSFISPRYYTAYAESVFPITFFIDGRDRSLQLDMNVARGFFQDGRMPDDFFRSNVSWTLNRIGGGINIVFTPHPIEPGANNGTINSYTLDPNSADFTDFCKLYTDFVNNTVRGLYPNAKGILLEALNKNLDFFFSALVDQGCTQVPPFV